MPRPSFFKEKKPEVLLFIRGMSKDYRAKGIPMSLNHVAEKLRLKFKFLPGPPPKAKKGETQKGDALKLVIYRLCNTNGIWFGDPKRMPSRIKAEPAKKAKKA